MNRLKENIQRQVIPGGGAFDMHVKRMSGKVQSPPPKKASQSKVVKKTVVSSLPKQPSKGKVPAPLLSKSSKKQTPSQ